MNEPATTVEQRVDEAVPEWALEDAFPEAPGGYGWVDRKGAKHECGSAAALAGVLEKRTGSRVELVWTPAAGRMVVPEEVPELHGTIWAARLERARADVVEARRQVVVFGLLAAFFVGRAWWRGGWAAVSADNTVGVALLLWLMFGGLPWYQAWKAGRVARRRKADELAGEEVAEARFDAWLMRQRAWCTWGLLGLLAVTGLVQLLPGAGWLKAGLVKDRYAAGEWWRLLTAPWLHGGLVHWLMNASALLYLGRRSEVLARWPHLLMVYWLAAMAGGVVSARWVPAPSVGASGGLLGLLGFLLVFETLHRELVPVSARRRLLAGLAMTGVIGVLGFRFIDNAAHAGGLAAGMAYGAVVFMRSSSARRPRATRADLLGGVLAGCGLVGGAVLAWVKLGG